MLYLKCSTFHKALSYGDSSLGHLGTGEQVLSVPVSQETWGQRPGACPRALPAVGGAQTQAQVLTGTAPRWQSERKDAAGAEPRAAQAAGQPAPSRTLRSTPGGRGLGGGLSEQHLHSPPALLLSRPVSFWGRVGEWASGVHASPGFLCLVSHSGVGPQSRRHLAESCGIS